jgi:hypothetical protein
MKQTLINVGSGLTGIGGIEFLDASTQIQPTEDTASTVIKVLIAIASLIPSIVSLFKKKPKTN